MPALKPITAGLLLLLSGISFAEDTGSPVPGPPVVTAAIASATAVAVVARLSPGAIRPVDYLVKDAKEMKGFFTLFQKEKRITGQSTMLTSRLKQRLKKANWNELSPTPAHHN